MTCEATWHHQPQQATCCRQLVATSDFLNATKLILIVYWWWDSVRCILVRKENLHSGYHVRKTENNLFS